MLLRVGHRGLTAGMKAKKSEVAQKHRIGQSALIGSLGEIGCLLGVLALGLDVDGEWGVVQDALGGRAGGAAETENNQKSVTQHSAYAKPAPRGRRVVCDGGVVHDIGEQCGVRGCLQGRVRA